MTKSKHTPGPWAHESKKGPHNAEGTVSSMGVYSVSKFETLMNDDDANEDDVIDSSWVCGIWGPIDAEDEANARLIAAAPDLLDALKASNEKLRALLFVGDDHPLIRANLNAIAKTEAQP